MLAQVTVCKYVCTGVYDKLAYSKSRCIQILIFNYQRSITITTNKINKFIVAQVKLLSDSTEIWNGTGAKLNQNGMEPAQMVQ